MSIRLLTAPLLALFLALVGACCPAVCEALTSKPSAHHCCDEKKPAKQVICCTDSAFALPSTTELPQFDYETVALAPPVFSPPSALTVTTTGHAAVCLDPPERLRDQLLSSLSVAPHAPPLA